MNIRKEKLVFVTRVFLFLSRGINMDINEKESGKEKMMFQALIGGLIIYVIYETVKGDTKEVAQMIDEEYMEEQKLEKEWNELKDKYYNRVSS